MAPKNLFRLNKENEAVKDRIIRYITNLFEHEEDYYKPVRADNIWRNNYIEYENNSEKNKTHIINNLKRNRCEISIKEFSYILFLFLL